jgi:carboxylesterase type B
VVDTIINTQFGAVRGSHADGVDAFKGIPFAAPPFVANRLRPPAPPAAWNGIRDALAFGPEPPQPRPDDPSISAMVPDPAVVGEDCLSLNIWSPGVRSRGLPVMVWIPGGMFEVGTGASYDGSRFARDGVVYVSINYRVGAEGFLYLEDGTANLGLLDQVAALEWVRDNIAAFGGDPDNVTIFGQSAGAMSVGTLLSMPRAKGLFRRAIAESGAADRVVSAKVALRIGRELAWRLGVPATRDAMAALPWDRLLAAQVELKADMLAHPDPTRWGTDVVASALPWQPVIDGDVVPDHPIAAIAAGAAADVDIIVGSNTDDWQLFAVMNGILGQVTDEILTGAVADHGYRAVAAYRLPPDDTLAAYRSAHPNADPGRLLSSIQTDWWCRIPAMRLADAHTPARAATYMYEFAWPSPVANGLFGACHALEIGFVFDTLDKGPDQLLGPLLGADPPQRLATAMHAAWVAFAKTGDPGWPKYGLHRRATMRFDSVLQVVDDPRSTERALWERLWEPSSSELTLASTH